MDKHQALLIMGWIEKNLVDSTLIPENMGKD